MTPPASMIPEIDPVRLLDNAGNLALGLEAILVSSLGILRANLGMVNFRLIGIFLTLEYFDLVEKTPSQELVIRRRAHYQEMLGISLGTKPGMF